MSYNIFCSLIDELIKNLPEYTSNKPQEINLILDNGAFNGLYLYGILLYLKKLEKLNRIKINKISGSSIGAAFATLYLTDNLNITEFAFDAVRGCWKEKLDLCKWREILQTNLLNKITDTDIKQRLDNKLFVNYINTKKCSEIVQSTYENVDELGDTLYKSSFIPILINGELSYEDCIDGFNPILFDDRTSEDNKNLFIHLFHPKILMKSINISSDKNASFRTIEGINEIHKFFIGEKQLLCSYVNDWTTKQLLMYRIRQIGYLCSVYFIRLIIVIKAMIPDTFYETSVYNFISQFAKKFYKDIFIKICL